MTAPADARSVWDSWWRILLRIRFKATMVYDGSFDNRIREIIFQRRSSAKRA